MGAAVGAAVEEVVEEVAGEAAVGEAEEDEAAGCRGSNPLLS